MDVFAESAGNLQQNLAFQLCIGPQAFEIPAFFEEPTQASFPVCSKYWRQTPVFAKTLFLADPV
ncbi:MAG: hypothetical protein AB7T18_17870 [Alphaproteobacteria bacterium]